MNAPKPGEGKAKEKKEILKHIVDEGNPAPFDMPWGMEDDVLI